VTLARFELVEVESAPSLVIELRGEVDSTNAANFERSVQALTGGGHSVGPRQRSRSEL
jgi:anti-anti-sigma regulatory factor